MRTTLTLDPDVARMLQDEVHRARKPFKQVVNEALRRALGPTKRPTKPFVVKPFKGGLAPGLDPTHLNRLNDELDDQRFLEESRRS